jgi:hypothetical protein
MSTAALMAGLFAGRHVASTLMLAGLVDAAIAARAGFAGQELDSAGVANELARGAKCRSPLPAVPRF